MNGDFAFLNERSGPTKIAVALFGKHQSAADHLEDMGLSTSSLVEFKRLVYVDGINECLSRLAWLKDLGTVESIPYDHQVLCTGPTGWLAAQLVHSSDAAGRKQFPLVLTLQANDFKVMNQICEIAKTLTKQITAASAARDLAGLRQVHIATQKHALEIYGETSTSSLLGISARESWVNNLLQEGEGDHESLWRCCYSLLVSGANAGRARVPIHAGSPWVSATFWASFLHLLCREQSAYLTLVWRNGQTFADTWLCRPSTRVLTTLFTSEISQPLTSNVPFNISSQVREKAECSLRNWLKQPELFPKESNTGELENSMLNRVCKGITSWFK